MLFGLIMILFAMNSAAIEEETVSDIGPEWLSTMDIYAKIFGGVLTGLGALFGFPAVILHFRKTRAEIKKLELESAALSSNDPYVGAAKYAQKILIDGSNNIVTVKADPQFLGPLLLLLDFIIAWVVLTFAGYASSLFSSGWIRTLTLCLIAAILLVPIYREAQRVKDVLRPPTEKNGEIA